MAIIDLAPGLHVLTNLDLDDPTCPRISGSWAEFARLREMNPSTSEFIAVLGEILAKHDVPLDLRSPYESKSLCLHLGDYGTRSSTIAILDRVGRWTYWHSDEPPCRGLYRLFPAFSDRTHVE
jgi:hypothetical protein